MLNHRFHAGDTVETAIERIAFGGDGVGKIDDVVIFIPYTAEGDVVRARLSSVKKNYCRGNLVEILSPSPFRVTPRCRYYARCGGCQYQHISYERQVLIKRNQVMDALERIGRIRGISVAEVVSSEKIYEYRGKAEFHLEAGKGGEPLIGFMNSGGNRLVDIEYCAIMDETINRSYAGIRRSLLARARHPGRQRLDKETLTVWSDQEDPCEEAAFEKAAAQEAKTKEDGIDETRFITRRVKGRVLQVPRNGFFQANGALIEKLIDTVIACGKPEATDSVLDAYCGSGLFSLFAASRCRSVLGIEVDPEAVFCAARNAGRFGIGNAGFVEGKTEEVMMTLVQEGFRPDLVILDPPRAGCEPGVVKGISALHPRRIVYVSCDPATQARDISIFQQEGFHPKSVQPIDMFPQTKHIEIIATLERP